MKSKIITIIILFAAFSSGAQNYVNKVIVLNEGHYDYTNQVQTVPVTIGAYDPATHLYQQFDVIQNTRFASDVITDGTSIYVAADSFIVRYDINTYQLLAVTTMPGVISGNHHSCGRLRSPMADRPRNRLDRPRSLDAQTQPGTRSLLHAGTRSQTSHRTRRL